MNSEHTHSETETCMCGQGGCGCGGGMRNFLTNEEKVQLLKEYKKNLEAEAKGVAEKIKELEKKA